MRDAKRLHFTRTTKSVDSCSKDIVTSVKGNGSTPRMSTLSIWDANALKRTRNPKKIFVSNGRTFIFQANNFAQKSFVNALCMTDQNVIEIQGAVGSKKKVQLRTIVDLW